MRKGYDTVTPIIPSRKVVACTVAIAASFTLGSCSFIRSSGARADSLSWSGVQAHGWPTKSAYALYLSSSADLGNDGAVTFISETGEISVLPVEPLEVGRVAAAADTLCVTTSAAIYDISSTAGARVEVPDVSGGVGHWVGVAGDGSCQAVYNSGGEAGGYVTNVIWSRSDAVERSVVPDVPGPVGISDGSIWVRNAGSATTDGTVSLYRTDTSSGQTSEAASWQTADERRPSGEATAFDAGHASDIFEYRGSLYYLENLTGVDSEGGMAELAPGQRAELRLATVDPQTGAHRSTALESTPWGWTEDQARQTAPIAVAMRKGYLYRGGLFTGDAAGNLVRVDLKTRTIERVGSLVSDASPSQVVLAAWRTSSVRLLRITGSDTGVIDEYSLDTGEKLKTTHVHGLSKLDDDLDPASLAALID